jgi:hypothetical protein
VSVTVSSGTTLPGSNDIGCLSVNALMGSDDNTCESTGGTWTPSAGNDWPTGNNNPRVTKPPTCHYKAPTALSVWDAGCYPTATATEPGRLETIAWGDNVYNGSNAVDFREIGKLKVLCVFRGISAPYGAVGHTERCSPAGGAPLVNYPKGTVIGVIQGLSSPAIGPTTELGNVASDQQRLILVK